MILQEKCYEDIQSKLEITDDVLKEYMNKNAADYMNPSGYGWTMIFREVKDFSDENECAAAKAEAQEYINKYFGLYSDVKSYMDKNVSDCAKDGFVKTLLGRRRVINQRQFN